MIIKIYFKKFKCRIIKEDISELLEELKKKIESSEGVAIHAKNKAKFEGWLKVGLCETLARKGHEVQPEYYTNNKNM
ncbi:MAG: hypothetical protein ARM1_0520 [Candidatus Micrarchaeota archaeon]|nr:MAG: hypothetical protein ARM1_0520 [Candidatus Micrarchaeota archaeon]